MISCIILFYLAHCRVQEARAGFVSDSRGFRLEPAHPDQLYARREHLANARAAERIWADRLARDPKDFASAWKLARARYWLGGHATDQDRKALYQAGIAPGRAAGGVPPHKPA